MPWGTSRSKILFGGNTGAVETYQAYKLERKRLKKQREKQLLSLAKSLKILNNRSTPYNLERKKGGN
jgi:hypothetical protein